MSDKVISSTTQEFLDVYDIINDMVLLKDGTASIILQIGTMNFSLLAEQEQDAVIFTYGSLLNSLNYPIQINIQSQTKDATKYLKLLDEQVQKASSDRKAALIRQYRDFVATLIRERNVLQKRFYIIVPASPGEMGMISPSGVLPGKTGFDASTVEKSTMLEKAMNVLEPRRDHLTAQFNRLGLFARQLTTQEIIQNFYINYNPEAAEGQEISSSENYATPLVRASFGKKFMPNDQSAPINPINPQGQVLQNLTSQSQALQNQIVTGPDTQEILPEANLLPETDLLAEANKVPEFNPLSETALPLDTSPEPIMELANSSFPAAALNDPTSPISADESNPLTTPVFEQVGQEQLAGSEQTISPEQPIVQEVDLKLDANLLNNASSDNSNQMPDLVANSSVPVSDLKSNLDLETNKTDSKSQEVAAPISDFAEEITPMQIQNGFSNLQTTQVDTKNQNTLPE